MKAQLFQEKIEKAQAAYLQLNAKDKRLSVYRLIFFILGLGLIIFCWTVYWALGLALAIGFLVSFSHLLKYHQRIITESKIAKFIIELNQNEIKALNNDISGFEEGARYQDATHNYTTDLDIFGKHSIFQMLSRCSTIFGENLLAKRLKEGLDIQDIKTYQNAIQELEPQLDTRQKLFAIGKMDLVGKQNIENLKTWINDKEAIGINKVLMYCSIILSWGLFLGLMTVLPWGTALIGFLPNAIFLYRYTSKVSKAHYYLDNNEKLLRPYASIISFIEELNFENSVLREVKMGFHQNNVSASKELSNLAMNLKQLDIRTNFFGILFNILFLWEDIYILKVEEWKRKNKEFIFKWFESLGELEYLSSLANYAYAHPELCYPNIEVQNELISEELGHPLLPSDIRVCNDFSMKTQKHIKVVTGSNMGGKSTFLRSVGTNMVLAYTGSRVCASKMKLPRLKVMSIMRTQDALQESTSSFYAELKRLKNVLDEVKLRDDVYILLDEILKGTNSDDKHKGAKAMIKQLLKNNGSGLISTHDLKLGHMAEQMPDEIDNICFEVEVKGQELYFDYKIKQGISKSFNATHLMRNIGIEI